jgi:hypothetical protein
VTVLAGEGDIGKGLTSSTLAAATTTAGGPWAGRAVLRQGGVFIISSEDDNPEWRRRIRVAGGDLKKVAIRGLEHTWDMLRTAEIEQSIRAAARQMGTDVQLLIIDNAGAYLPEGGNLNDNVLARACIGALNRLAAELHIAVVLVHHTRKGGASKNIDAVSGGMAWTQAPRSVVMMAEHPTEAEHKVLWVAKANWAKKPPMFELTIEDCDGTPKVAWIGETDIASASLMSEDATTVGNASQWLLKVLKSGPILSGDMEELAKEAGLSWSSVKRAKQSMPRVTSRKESTRDGNWCWVLL